MNLDVRAQEQEGLDAVSSGSLGSFQHIPMALGQRKNLLRNSLRVSKILAVYLAACLLLMLSGTHSLALALVTNGDFETGDLTGWTWTPTQYSEPAMNPTVAPFDTSGSGASLAFRVNPGTDMDHIGLEEGGVLSQTLDLALGTDYEVSIAAAFQYVGGGTGNEDAGRVRLYLGGELLWDWDVGWISAGTTVRNSYSAAYTPSSSGPHELEILLTRTYANYSPTMYHWIDNVNVVPEPSTALLLGVGLIGLAFNGERRGKRPHGTVGR